MPIIPQTRLKEVSPGDLTLKSLILTFLKNAVIITRKAYEKEHVTPYIYENPAKFKNVQVEALKKLYGPDIRVTIDMQEDYKLLCVVFDYLHQNDKYFGAHDVIRLFKEKPELKSINKKVMQKRYHAICN